MISKCNIEICRRAARAALALAAVFVLGVFAPPSAEAQKYTHSVLYTFRGEPDGAGPDSSLLRDAEGNLYGTTFLGGAYDAGTVFEVTNTGQERVLYSFTGGADGGQPYAGLIQDAAGNLYGTAFGGGSDGYGVVFEVTMTGQESVLFTFTGGIDGGYPFASLIQDAKGNLHGTTVLGGAYDAGTVFEVTKTGQERVLYSFTGGADGENPVAGLVQDAKGNLYGTTLQGGLYFVGVVFKVTKTGEEKVLYTLRGYGDGGYLRAGVIQDAEGNLYGAAAAGGDGGPLTISPSYDAGVVFKLDP